MSIITIGIDLAKTIFAVHGVNESGKAELIQPNPKPSAASSAADCQHSRHGRSHRGKTAGLCGGCSVFCQCQVLAAFIGICSRQRQSWSSVKERTMISRTGHAALRKALYMPGLVALRHTQSCKRLASG